MAEMKSKQPSYEDAAGCQSALFEWAESFDTKDWDRLSKCVTPLLYVDYRQVMGKIWESMPAEQFLSMASSDKFLGNPRIKTQHFIGASRYVCNNNSAITGYHQMYVAHQKYRDDELVQVLHQGHAHGKATIQYRKVDGVWKFAGLTPDIRWSEHEYDKIFQ